MPVQSLKQYLNQHEIKYLIIQHSPAYTAQEIAESVHVPGRFFAKTVVVRIDGRLAVTAIPATRRVPLERLRRELGAESVEIASEAELRDRFPDCELGAMPPFGNLFEMDTYASRELSREEEIAFNAGSQTEVMLLAWRDYQRLAQPRVIDL
ncbi:MAG: YbaK/EbsC family protein [Ectothiorhodospiraceae bacterium]|jgi:Ala-tRNA(Pro) deacylase